MGGGSDDPEFLQSDLELRFTDTGQNATRNTRAVDMAWTQAPGWIPFEVWDLEHNRQLCVGTADFNHSGGVQDTTLENWEQTLDPDWIFVYDRDYAVYQDTLLEMFDNPYSGWAWEFDPASKFSLGDVLQLHFLNPVEPGVDRYTWTTVSANRYDQASLEQIQVFPNPFLGYDTEMAGGSDPYVTISNLPSTGCTVRIYSLGGQLVRRIDHQSGSYEIWDLRNTHGAYAASGMYLVHIEVPVLGSKILKLAVFQPAY